MSDHQDEYSDELIQMLELVWGNGFLSPGGPDAVHRIVDGVDLKGKLVLDIGCGIGGIDILLARDYGAKVVGIDIEADVIRRAKDNIQKAGLTDRVETKLVQPGPLDFEDSTFDVVFGKDAWLHIPDKKTFFADVFRVLKPGGQLIAGDWLGGPTPWSSDMKYYVELEGISYYLDTLDNYRTMLEGAGFHIKHMQDISAAYGLKAQQEYGQMKNTIHEEMLALLGQSETDHFVENWRMLTVVLENGELRPSRFHADKPY